MTVPRSFKQDARACHLAISSPDYAIHVSQGGKEVVRSTREAVEVAVYSLRCGNCVSGANLVHLRITPMVQKRLGRSLPTHCANVQMPRSTRANHLELVVRCAVYKAMEVFPYVKSDRISSSSASKFGQSHSENSWL